MAGSGPDKILWLDPGRAGIAGQIAEKYSFLNKIGQQGSDRDTVSRYKL